MAHAAGVACTPIIPRCDHQSTPLGIDRKAPEFSWQMDDARRGARQRAYQLVVATSPELLKQGKPDVWDSGRVEGDKSTGVVYAGPVLEAKKRYFWNVRVWDKDNKPSDMAEPTWFETAFLDPADFKAEWIGFKVSPEAPAEPLDKMKWIWVPNVDARTSAPKGNRYFRTTFDVDGTKKLTTATLYAVADDSCISFLNGQLAGQNSDWHRLVPGSVLNKITSGRNVLAISAHNNGGPAALAVMLKLSYADGTVQRVLSGEGNWKCDEKKREHWQTPGFDDAAWANAKVIANMGESPWGTPPLGSPWTPAAYIRKAFQAEKKVKSARVYVTAHGSYRLHVNGERVGHDILTPDWTDYRKRTLYQTYDVTDLVRKGENAIGAIVGDGWYASGLGWELQRNCFGDSPNRFLMQMDLTFDDGTTRTIVTDKTWKADNSPIRRSELYAGETYDATEEQPGWDEPGFNDGKWHSVTTFAGASQLQAQHSPTIQVTDTIKPKSMTSPAPDVYIYDMGQNMVGHAQLKVTGPRGTVVRMRFAEILQPNGTIYTENLRSAEATDSYTLRGEGEEVFEPHFTYHGFRYVELTGYPGEPTNGTITGIVFNTAAPWSGSFKCSDEKVNKLQENIRWGQRGNFESVPTDCPQRDERLGWMGDACIFWQTAVYNMDLQSFTHKWMKDVCEAQSAEGGFSNVSPRVIATADGAPAWGDAGIILPWVTFRQYGDTQIVNENWDAMCRWMEYIHKENPDLIWNKRRSHDYGDWVPANSVTPKDVIATSYWALDARCMADMARATGRQEDAAKFDKLYHGIRDAFVKQFVTDDGKVGNGSQTCQVLALNAGLVPAERVTSATKVLVDDIRTRGNHLSTGFLGTACLMPVLSEHGQNSVAYDLLLQETYPSWIYMISKGATTIWERWNGDSGDPAMNSFNHYAYGAVGDWLFRYVLGIDTAIDKPGFEKVVIRPHVDRRLKFAKGSYDSVHGPVASEWRFDGGNLMFSVRIPANTSARVFVPTSSATKVTESGKPLADAGISVVATAPDHVELEVPAGAYEFQSPMP